MKLGKKIMGITAVGLGIFTLAGCGSEAATQTVQSANVASSSSDKTSYGTNEVDLNVVPHAIYMVNADAADAAAKTPTGNAKSPFYKVGDLHDVVAPSTFVVKAGQKVTVNVWNYDGGPHSLTLDDPSQIPGFNLMITAGKESADKTTVTPVKSTVTFTAPDVAKGKILDIAWYCAMPCDGPDHRGMLPEGNNLKGYDGIMAGHIVVMG